MSECGDDLRRRWDAAAEADLARLWPRPDHSAATIGKLLGFTRNAIIAKAHRLGLAAGGLKKTIQKPRERRRQVVPRQPVNLMAARWTPKQTPIPNKQIASPSPKNVRLFDLCEGQCRWPMWGQNESTGFFCGADAITGLPYCGHHCSLAYTRRRVLEAAE